ncbi:MAG: glycoside hydrolase family 2 protein, partial [Phycisphaerales bacterium JB039]
MRISLDGDWEILPDPMDRGRRDRWFAEAPEEGWRPITVPSAWQGVVGETEADVCWYRRRLPEAPAGGGGVWVRCESSATDTQAWVGGIEVGASSGDWAPFEFDITRAAADAGPQAELLVRVDRRRPDPPRWIDGAPVNSGHITKGFHDVLSMQHAGLWGSVSLRTTGSAAIRPGGALVNADAETGEVRVTVDLHEPAPGAGAIVEIAGPDGNAIGSADARFDGARAVVNLRIDDPALWSPESPTLYTARVRLEVDGSASDEASVRFGFRTVRTGGSDNKRILLNGAPVFLTGMLDWGHEPETGAPAPAPEVVRARFEHLKAMGFNLVCICMWYPPEWFYDIADETGMMLWQEHPVWKSPMRPELNDEFKAQFDRFFRRDVNHPSVVIVSGSCEHERIEPEIAEWWWSTARQMLPDRLVQVQTAFLEWGESDRSDVHDEHTYETMGRWVQYQQDLEDELNTRSARPFVMGESILYATLPPVRELRQRYGDDLPWWAPIRMGELEAFCDDVEQRFGPEALERFNRDGRNWHLAGRKRQMEVFRQRPSHAGLVMNHLRDVPACPCGFQDDLGAWRFEPAETRPWLAPAALLLRTPGELRGFAGGQRLACEIGVSNFGPERLRGRARIEIRSLRERESIEVDLDAPCGEVIWAPIEIDLPRAADPTPVAVRAEMDGAEANAWTLWAMPERAIPDGVAIADVAGFTEAERALTFEERKYSSGWGDRKSTR